MEVSCCPCIECLSSHLAWAWCSNGRSPLAWHQHDARAAGQSKNSINSILMLILNPLSTPNTTHYKYTIHKTFKGVLNHYFTLEIIFMEIKSIFQKFLDSAIWSILYIFILNIFLYWLSHIFKSREHFLKINYIFWYSLASINRSKHKKIIWSNTKQNPIFAYKLWEFRNSGEDALGVPLLRKEFFLANSCGEKSSLKLLESARSHGQMSSLVIYNLGSQSQLLLEMCRLIVSKLFQWILLPSLLRSFWFLCEEIFKRFSFMIISGVIYLFTILI